MKKSEHGEQVAVVLWANYLGGVEITTKQQAEAQHLFGFTKSDYGARPYLGWLFAVPNGGDRHPVVAGKLKAEGVKKGVPDLILPYPNAVKRPKEKGLPTISVEYHGLFIEMKCRDTKGRVSKEQKEWHEYLEAQGYKVVVCWSADEAIKEIMDYILN